MCVAKGLTLWQDYSLTKHKKSDFINSVINTKIALGEEKVSTYTGMYAIETDK